MMSETIDTRTKPKSPRVGTADRQALIQVEKWLETIREIAREQVKN
jgi:hypothetical protein